MKDIQKFLRKGILELAPYVPGKPIEEVQSEYGLSEVIKMASNENPLGPSPKALASIKREVRKAHLYPEGSCKALRREMSKRLGIEEEMVTFSNGVDNLLSMVANAFINEGDEIVMADPTFFVYTTVSKIMGGLPVYVKLKNGVHDLEAMSDVVNHKTKLIFICNPNNPTGTIVKRKGLDDFLSKLPEQSLLILDEAYIEFASDQNCPDGLQYIKEGHPVIALRTFSKLYGLAALRIGYALGCRELIAALNSVREPFPVSRVAQAGALAALADEPFKKKVLRNNERGKAYLYKEFGKMGLPYLPSHANFVLVDLKRDSQEIFKLLLQEGIIIRPGHLWNYPTCARITIGTAEENRRFIKALRKLQ